MTKLRVFIAGAAGHGRVVQDVLQSEDRYEVVGFVAPDDQSIGDLPVLGNDPDIGVLIEKHKLSGFIVAVGDNRLRKRITEAILTDHPQLMLVTGIHRSAVLAKNVEIGAGSVVMAQAVVNPGAAIGRGCIVNTAASIDHDCQINDYVSISPQAAIGGHCTIGAGSFIGINATLIHGINIGNETVIGAGAVVVRSIGDNIVAFGTPAREISKRNNSDTYL